MNSTTCPKCLKSFAKASRLQRHLQRKTPCAAIVGDDELTDVEREKLFACRFCGRRFSAQPNLSRHQKMSCRVAAKEGGMELLFEHTLQRQLEEQRSETESLRREVSELSSLLRQQLLAVKGGGLGSAQQVNIGQQNNTNTNMTVNVDARRQYVLRSFKSAPEDGGPIAVTLEQVRELFIGPGAHPALKAWMETPSGERLRMGEDIVQKAADALVAMIQALHAQPEQRNIFLNPKRADQVLVFEEAPGCDAENPHSWTVMPLREAILRLCDGLAHRLTEDVLRSSDDPKKVNALCGGPGHDVWHRVEMQDGVGSLPLTWQGRRDECAEKARPGLAAHLQTLTRRLPHLIADALTPEKQAATVVSKKQAAALGQAPSGLGAKKAAVGFEETKDANGEQSIEVEEPRVFTS